MDITIALLSSLIGFGIAAYIYRKQVAKKPLMCPRKSPCETVITSPQATTYGISNTVLGMAYYAFMAFLLLCIAAGGESAIVEVLLIALGAAGFVFSLYLVRIQHVVIKQWCVWCLGSALMATILFAAVLILVI